LSNLNKMTNTTKSTLVTLLALSLLIVGTSVVSAQDANKATGQFLRSPWGNPESVKAVEQGDFNAWRDAVAPKATFDALVKANKLKADGDLKGAKAVLDEAGVKGPMGGGQHMMFRGESQNHEAIHAAIENNEFTAWKAAMADLPNADKFVTEENFNSMVKMHELKESGDKEGLRTLRMDRLKK